MHPIGRSAALQHRGGGRCRLARQDYPGGFSTTYAYTALGYMKEVRNTATPSLVYWRADAADALGHITQQTFGNQVVGTDVYDGPTGRLIARRAGAGDGVLNLTLTYDALGNLKTRHDGNLGNWASYTYDALNRLRTEDLWGPSFGGTQSIAWTYDAIGNISSRSDVGIYSYPASGAGSVRPHAVAGIAGTVNGVANPGYSYDANGNLINGAGRTITWTSHDLPATITQGSNSLQYLYRADLGRLRERLVVNGSVQRSTLYLHPGNAGALEYEQESGTDGVKHKYFVTAQGRAVAVVTQPAAGGAPSTQYLHYDQLGSVAVVTGEAGGVVERLQYEPFGKRRLPDMQTDAAGTWRPQSTDRGFTGHEHLDEVGLVHMNGRVYDPAIGRFVSADPTDFSGAGDMQALNGYAYVRNNPLALVDPTGYEGEAAESSTQTLGRVSITGCGCFLSSSGFGGFGDFGGFGRAPGLRANAMETDSGDGVSRFQLTRLSPEGLTVPFEVLLEAVVISGHSPSSRGTLGIATEDVRRWVSESGGFEPPGGWPTPEENLEGKVWMLEQDMGLDGLSFLGALRAWQGIPAANLGLTGRAARGRVGPGFRAPGATTIEGQGFSFWSKSTFKGVRVYQRDGLINPAQLDARGRTNLQRMRQGLAPIGADGKSINLHHMLQTRDSPLAEMTASFHQRHSRVIHINPNTIPSGIDRAEFNTFRSEYWMNRAEDFSK